MRAAAAAVAPEVRWDGASYHAGQQEVIGQELEPRDVLVRAQTVNLQSRLVIQVHILLLGDRKHGLVVEPSGARSKDLPLRRNQRACRRRVACAALGRGWLGGWGGAGWEGGGGTHCTSRTDSLSCISQRSWWRDQSNVATWPLLPPRSTKLRARERRRGVRGRCERAASWDQAGGRTANGPPVARVVDVVRTQLVQREAKGLCSAHSASGARVHGACELPTAPAGSPRGAGAGAPCWRC